MRRALNRASCCTAEFMCIVRVDSNCIQRIAHACFAVARDRGFGTSSAATNSFASSLTPLHCGSWN